MAEYIDRQAVLDAIFPVDPENDGSDGCTVVLQNQSFTSTEIEGIVCSIPAADVRPVVHADWFFDSEWWDYVCTHCHGRIGNVKRYKFCPHCGAQMNGGASQ